MKTKGGQRRLREAEQCEEEFNAEGTEIAHRGHGKEVGSEADGTVGCEGMGKR
jgi:hypothetical protein